MQTHQVFADHLALIKWADSKLETASDNAKRFVAALADMAPTDRNRFLAVAFLYSGSLSEILPPREDE